MSKDGKLYMNLPGKWSLISLLSALRNLHFPSGMKSVNLIARVKNGMKAFPTWQVRLRFTDARDNLENPIFRRVKEIMYTSKMSRHKYVRPHLNNK